MTICNNDVSMLTLFFQALIVNQTSQRIILNRSFLSQWHGWRLFNNVPAAPAFARAIHVSFFLYLPFNLFFFYQWEAAFFKWRTFCGWGGKVLVALEVRKCWCFLEALASFMLCTDLFFYSSQFNHNFKKSTNLHLYHFLFLCNQFLFTEIE